VVCSNVQPGISLARLDKLVELDKLASGCRILFINGRNLDLSIFDIDGLLEPLQFILIAFGYDLHSAIIQVLDRSLQL